MDREMAETLVRTGSGTVMGNLLRRYWAPALLSREIEDPDCPPVRVRSTWAGTRRMAFDARITG